MEKVKTIASFNLDLNDIATRIDNILYVPKNEVDQEIDFISERLSNVEDEINKFQKNPQNTRHKDKITEYEERIFELRNQFDKIKTNNRETKVTEIYPSPSINEAKLAPDSTIISRGEFAIKESRKIAEKMIKTVDKMREEVNMIEDEVMLQREKIVHINEELKETQNINLQTKKIINKFTITIKQDVFIKTLIFLVAGILISILIMGVIIRFKKNPLIIANFIKNSDKKMVPMQRIDTILLTDELNDEYVYRFISNGYSEYDFYIGDEDPIFLKYELNERGNQKSYFGFNLNSAGTPEGQQKAPKLKKILREVDTNVKDSEDFEISKINMKKKSNNKFFDLSENDNQLPESQNVKEELSAANLNLEDNKKMKIDAINTELNRKDKNRKRDFMINKIKLKSEILKGKNKSFLNE